jgi:hypothetical protein
MSNASNGSQHQQVVRVELHAQMLKNVAGTFRGVSGALEKNLQARTIENLLT